MFCFLQGREREREQTGLFTSARAHSLLRAAISHAACNLWGSFTGSSVSSVVPFVNGSDLFCVRWNLAHYLEALLKREGSERQTDGSR